MYFIGLNIGTVAVKALVTDETGAVISRGHRTFNTKRDGGEATQNPEDWWICSVGAVRDAVSGIDPKGVAAIGLSAAGSSMTAVDKYGNPVIDAITCVDIRSKAESGELERILGSQRIYRKCGCLNTPSADAAKIMWIKRNRMDVSDRAESYLSTLDFLNLRLVGNAVSDPTIAAARLLYNIQLNDWDEEILRVLGLSQKFLPQVLPTGMCIGNLTKYAAVSLGLEKSVKVYNGAYDCYCSAIGCGTINLGDFMIRAGKEWKLFGIADSLIFTPSYLSPGIFPSGHYGAIAELVSAGGVMSWFSRLIDKSYKEIDAEAANRAQSAYGLLFMPYNLNRGFPHKTDSDIGGQMYGMTVSHDKYDIARALMEGAAFETKLALEEYRRYGIKSNRIVMTGGAAKSDVWRKIVGEVLGIDIYFCEEVETSALGAAIIAAVGYGIFPDIKTAVPNFVRTKRIDEVSVEMTDFYKEKYRLYKQKIGIL